jgi:Rrf2 family protein
MRLTKQGEYALRSLISIGIAHELGRELLPVSELAVKEALPLKFVERILAVLRDAGWVAAQRGKAGGYRLAIPATAIKVGDVVRRIDGRLAPIGCASELDYERCSCPDEAHCGLRMLMIDVRNAIAGILDRYTLADIVAVTLLKLRRDGIAPPLAKPLQLAGSRSDSKSTPRRPLRPADPRDGLLASLGLDPSQSTSRERASKKKQDEAKSRADALTVDDRRAKTRSRRTQR